MLIIDNPIIKQISKETNFILFIHKELYCAIIRNRVGCLCGYVAIPAFHKLYGKSYNEKIEVENFNDIKFNGNYIGLLCQACEHNNESNLISLDLFFQVHGGLTYASKYLNGLEIILKDHWWFGFDAGHGGDIMPYLMGDREIDGDIYKDFEYIKKEVEKLAEQLAEYK
jgi:hypothetical protein